MVQAVAERAPIGSCPEPGAPAGAPGWSPKQPERTPGLQLELPVENVNTVADLNLEVYPVLASFRYRKNNSFSASTSE